MLIKGYVNNMTNEEMLKEIFGVTPEAVEKINWRKEYHRPMQTNIERFKEVFPDVMFELDIQGQLIIDNSKLEYNFWNKEYKGD